MTIYFPLLSALWKLTHQWKFESYCWCLAWDKKVRQSRLFQNWLIVSSCNMSFFVWDNGQTAGARNLNDEMSFTIGSNQVIRKQVYFLVHWGKWNKDCLTKSETFFDMWSNPWIEILFVYSGGVLEPPFIFLLQQLHLQYFSRKTRHCELKVESDVSPLFFFSFLHKVGQHRLTTIVYFSMVFYATGLI